MSTLWNQKNYLLQLPYIFANNIYEYDIKKANINILLALGAIDINYYNKLYSLPRMERQIEIGWLLRRYPNMSDILSDGIIKYKKLFFENNNLEDSDILSIKNDAIFIINKIPKYTCFDNIEFINKNTYSSFIKILKNIEIYFKSDMINNIFQFDVKGINDELLKLHENYMCFWISSILYNIELGDLEIVIKDIKNFYNDYVSRSLPIEYYRSFDSISQYNIILNGTRYLLNSINDKYIDNIDISTNLYIIRQLFGYVTEIHFSRKKF